VSAAWVVNGQVPSDWSGRDPVIELSRRAQEQGLEGPGVGLMTAAKVADVATAEVGGVRVDATVGLGQPELASPSRLAVRDHSPAGEMRRPGTINIVAQVPSSLTDAALVNLVATATEAKAQALVEIGSGGTGTATDAVVVTAARPGRVDAAETSSAERLYGGPRSAWGEPLATAVHEAVVAGGRRDLAGRARLTLVMGGARSGKSALAERWAAAVAVDGLVTYVATAQRPSAAADADFAARIAAHRRRRPSSWVTSEPSPEELAAVVATTEGPLLVDSLGTWMARLADPATAIDGLVSALQSRAGPTFVVSDEVGLGVHPPTDIGRRFRDGLGRANEAIAAVADRVVLVVAGRPLDLPHLP